MLLGLFILSALAYGAATVGYGADRAQERTPAVSRAGFAARIGLIVAVLLHVGAVGAQCVEGDHPFKNIFLATSFGTLLTVSAYLPLSRGGRLHALGSVMASVGLLGLVLGVVFSGLGEGQVPAAEGLASAHVLLASAGFAGFLLAAMVAMSYMIAERRLRTKRFRPSERTMSLTALDRLHHRLVLTVTPVFTLAIVTGVLWVLELGDPSLLRVRRFELVAAAVAWCAAVGLLVARAAWGTRGRQAAQLTLVAFAAIVVIIVLYGVRG